MPRALFRVSSARVKRGKPKARVFTDGFDTFGLEGNESFNSASPTLKDGAALTGDSLTQYNAALYWIENAAATTGDWRYVNPDWALTSESGNLYSIARVGQTALDPMMALFRVTGDLRILDRVASAFEDMRTQAFVIPWEDLASSDWSGVDNPTADPLYSPYSKLLYRNSDYTLAGTDLSNINVVKIFALMAEFAWALHLNRNKTSPAGLNYNSLADLWGQEVEDWVKAWSEAGSGDWHDNYRGDEYTGASRTRAAWGEYPVMSRNEAHAAIDTPILQYYIGRLGGTGLWDIANPSDALTMSDTIMSDMRGNGSFVACSTSYGDSLLCISNRWFDGDRTTALESTYSAYVAGRMVQQWMIGRWRNTFTLSDLTKFQRTYASAISADGSMTGNLGTNTTGSGLDVSGGSARSVRQQSINGYAKMLVFEGAGETHLSTVADTIQTGDSGGYSTPTSGIMAAYLCIKGALESAGDI